MPVHSYRHEVVKTVNLRWISERPGRAAGYAAVTVLAALTVWVITQAPGEEPSDAAAKSPGSSSQAAAPRPQAAPQPRSAVPNRCPASADACVDERLRISWLQQDGKISYGPVPVMPGTQGADQSISTPKGVFHVQRKDADHVSGEFGEPMPNSVFFAEGGIAFHQGSLNSTSHGCVHLSEQDSKHYFDSLPRGAEVAVF